MAGLIRLSRWLPRGPGDWLLALGGGLLLAAILVGLAAPPARRLHMVGSAPAAGMRAAAPAAPRPPAPPAAAPALPASTGSANPKAHAALLARAYVISSEYLHYPNGSPHWGLDIAAIYGVVQTAPVGGVVENVLRGCVQGDQACGQGWGNHVWWVSSDAGHHILLGHFAEIFDTVQVGATLTAGEPLGLTGATGYATAPHAHMQVNLGACCTDSNTMNPAWEFPWIICGNKDGKLGEFAGHC